MKISDVTTEFARDYCGVSDNSENTRIETCMAAAEAVILGKTGLTADEADTHEDLTIAYLVLTNEFYTNRDYTADQAEENPCVKQILALHSVNYL